MARQLVPNAMGIPIWVDVPDPTPLPTYTSGRQWSNADNDAYNAAVQRGDNATAAALVSVRDQVQANNEAFHRANNTGPYAPSGGGGGGSAPAAPSGPSAAELALLAQLRSFFNDNGMGDLFAGAEKYVRQGYSGDSIYFMLEQDSQYKEAYNKRFAANEIRRKNGLQALLPGTYVATEAAIRQVMISKGVPSGLFDDASDLTTLIGNDVSAVEVGERLDRALDYINYSGNAEVKTQLRDLYGLTDAEMAAYVLDPTKTLDYLDRQSKTNLRRASVGAAAKVSGVNISADLRDQVAGMLNQGIGDSFDQLQPRFTNIAGEQGTYTKLANMGRLDASTDDLVREAFDMEGAADVTRKKRNLASQERARFSGSSGIAQTSLNTKPIGSQ